jgi:phosphoglycolate phosphatase
MKSVIFDLDGTLADTSKDLLAAANACFRDMGYGDLLGHPSDAGIALRGGRSMLRAGLGRVQHADPDPVIARYYPILLEHYTRQIADHTVLYPGAMEAVETLKALGYGVGICTNKPFALAEQLLQALQVRGAFGALVGPDTLGIAKPDPAPLFETVRLLGGDPSQTLLVGDSDTDRNTSTAAGVPSILVTFGPSGQDMAALEPEALLENYADLPGIVQELLGD